jgi:transcriptional regulator with XRE-family HTH domain
MPPANTLAEQLVRQRTSLGMSQKESAKRIGVDAGTLAKWEQGKREPQGSFLGRVERFLQAGVASGRRRAG